MSAPFTPATYRYRLPLPPKGVGSNARGHWAARSKAEGAYRAECAQAYRDQGVPPEPLVRAVVDIEMRVCRKRVPQQSSLRTADEYQAWVRYAFCLRPRDEGNVHAAVKAAIDALQPERIFPSRLEHGAGVVVRDDARRLRFMAPRLAEVASFAEEGVFVTVVEQPSE